MKNPCDYCDTHDLWDGFHAKNPDGTGPIGEQYCRNRQEPTGEAVRAEPVSEVTRTENEPQTATGSIRPRSVKRYDWERELWNCPDIPGAYKGTLAALSFFTDFESGRNAHPGESLLEEVTCASRSTVNRALTYGRNEGWIYRVKKGNKKAGIADEYWLTLPRHDHSHELDAVKQRASH